MPSLSLIKTYVFREFTMPTTRFPRHSPPSFLLVSWLLHNLPLSFQLVDFPDRIHYLHLITSIKWIHCPAKGVNTTSASVVTSDGPESLKGLGGSAQKPSYGSCSRTRLEKRLTFHLILVHFEGRLPFTMNLLPPPKETDTHTLFHELERCEVKWRVWIPTLPL